MYLSLSNIYIPTYIAISREGVYSLIGAATRPPHYAVATEVPDGDIDELRRTHSTVRGGYICIYIYIYIYVDVLDICVRICMRCVRTYG
jgi:hypothetical protein